MKHHSETEVLVAGAGPVGMFTALLLKRAGIDVQIIDQADRTTSRSYSCGLHPHSLSLLSQAGFIDQVQAAGHRISAVAFYDSAERRAEVDLARLPGEFPYALALPQDALENVLEGEFVGNGKSGIRWLHRLSELHPSDGGVKATVEKRGFSARGYVIPHMGVVVESELEINARFVVGADGPASEVRTCLNLDWPERGVSELFTLCDFESDAQFGNEARVLVAGEELEMLWPLSDRTGHLSIRLHSLDEPSELPHKDRNPFIVRESEERKREFEKWVRARTPWFTQPLKEINWLCDAPFTPRLVNEFGRGRCWLVGGAAHETGPIGFQSMNIGLSEAMELADKLKRILREDAPLEILETYGQNRRREWEFLFDLGQAIVPETGVNQWVRDNAARILQSLPASSADLVSLADQLGIEFLPRARKSVLEFETACLAGKERGGGPFLATRRQGARVGVKDCCSEITDP